MFKLFELDFFMVDFFVFSEMMVIHECDDVVSDVINKMRLNVFNNRKQSNYMVSNSIRYYSFENFRFHFRLLLLNISVAV